MRRLRGAVNRLAYAVWARTLDAAPEVAEGSVLGDRSFAGIRFSLPEHRLPVPPLLILDLDVLEAGGQVHMKLSPGQAAVLRRAVDEALAVQAAAWMWDEPPEWDTRQVRVSWRGVSVPKER